MRYPVIAGFDYHIVVAAVLAVLLAVAAVIDARRGIIPNKLVATGLGFMAFTLLLTLVVLGPSPALTLASQCFFGLLAGGAPVCLIILVTKGGMGAGDMKLLAMVGAFVGVKAVLVILVLSIVLCGLYAAVLLICRLKTLGSKLAFGPFIALSGLIVVAFEKTVFAILLHYYGI